MRASMRPGPRVLAHALVVVLGLAALVLAQPAAPRASAADTRQFTPGNIISNALFFDGAAMDAAEVQAFLKLKNPSCLAGADGTPCLRDYRQDTVTRAADGVCTGEYLGAAAETAATIITKVGRACGVSQRVLLVLLQKEQGLVTGSGSSLNSTRYVKATGFACPDTAACDTRYNGFFNQVYSAARQYKNYAANPGRYGYKAGVVNQVRFHPNTACGSAGVFIENQATAGLYNYTPYQPNAAALAAGTRTGDACSSYGNRNFWNYFTDWFGSTQNPGAAAIAAFWDAAGGASGWLGAGTTSYVCGLRDGGCGRAFERGLVYWSPASGAHAMSGGIGGSWMASGWETGVLAYPVSEMRCGFTGGGCAQVFQGGSVYWSPASGSHVVTNEVQAVWAATGWETGSLGYPITDPVCGMRDGGCGQGFQGGSIYWSPASGVHAVAGGIRAVWMASGWEGGPLGYPMSDMRCGFVRGGCGQAFQGGSIYWSPATGPHMLSNDVLKVWAATGWEAGSLGYPITEAGCGMQDGGCGQGFERGSIYWSPASGVHAVEGGIRAAWAASGWERGPLGYPVDEMSCGLRAGGCAQTFQGGSIYWSPASGVHPVAGGIRAAWAAADAEAGWMGYPLSDMRCGFVGGGCGQVFQGGSVYWSPATGPHSLSAEVQDVWAGTGWEAGALGYPVTDAVCGMRDGGCGQDFQRGSIYWSPASGVHAIESAFRDVWAARGWENGPLGYPTRDRYPVPGGSRVDFQGGALTMAGSTGAVTVTSR